MNELEDKLALIIYECDQHVKMINHAFEKTERFLPLNEKVYQAFSADQISYIDQFLFRFSKLQDTMGEKLFPTMLYLLGEDYDNKPFIDLLNRLEKLELLSKEMWLDLRKIRNEVAHEYSFNQEELLDSLNDIFSVKDTLLGIYHTVRNYCFQKIHFTTKEQP